jgi:hypothetical protein
MPGSPSAGIAVRKDYQQSETFAQPTAVLIRECLFNQLFPDFFASDIKITR